MAGHFRASRILPTNTNSNRGPVGASRPPTRTGSTRRARPVRGSSWTKTAHRVASPSAGCGFSPGILVTKRRTAGAFCMPITES
jgi:hypothetical protein